MADQNNERSVGVASRQVPSNTRLGWLMSLAVASAYAAFLLAGAFANKAMGQSAFGSVPWSFVLGVGMLVGAVSMTGIYVLITNTREDGAGQ